jgi:alpha-amylase/alpha-mannosidase (GH57 family)
MTRVALLWHMHQPFYQDLVTGEHILPWVRLHALKDYWGMVALLREFPDVKVTFNLVPSMLVQLEAFARDDARDRHLELGLKPAAELTEEERGFCVENFFHAHKPRMIDPYPRYAELLARRGPGGSGVSGRAHASLFSTEDLRDLQVWHKLTWVDAFYLERDERIRALVYKGRDFTEADKLTLRNIELEVLRRVIPEYREAAARGQVELSTSPFYHPILPLLCDTDVYLRTHPDSRRPREPFRHPEDAAEQLHLAVTYHERLFGQRPQGVWPSEGSVSDAMVPLVAGAGLRWMATDEEILARSLGRGFSRDSQGNLEQLDKLYRPYRVGRDATVNCGFRDHTLSDLIGFTYASWSADAAADDFVQRLTTAGERYAARTGGGDATIFVILDGENAWEHYEGQGRPFLRALYTRLGSHTSLRTVTMAEACDGASETLPSIFPGSWINGDFYIWAGHQDDHRAWSQLVDARRALQRANPGLPPIALAQAREEMFIAEGSDWFWWYGDDHSSDHDLEFDDLFRRHVRNVYRALNQPIPEELFVTNISTEPPDGFIHPPTGFIAPSLDGEVTSYFEWIGAGCVEAGAAAGAMHQVAPRAATLTLVEFGFDLDNLFVRVDASKPMREVLALGLHVSLKFLKPVGIQVVAGWRDGVPEATLLERGETHERSMPVGCLGLGVAAGRILEIRVPFDCLGLRAGQATAFIIALRHGTEELEHHPRHRAIEVAIPGAEFASANWTA